MRNRAVLIRGGAKGAWRSTFRKDAFVKRHGDVVLDVGGIPYPMLYGLKGGARMKARRYVKSSMVQQLQQQNNGTSTSSSCFRADEDAERCKPGMLCRNRNNGTERCTAEPLYVFSRVFPTDEDAERLLQDIPEISFLRYDDLPKENRGGASHRT